MSDFKRIALASAFSPRFLPLLAEARSFTEKIGQTFSVIHVGEKTAETEARFAEAFREAGIELPIFWVSGDVPSQAIMSCVRDEGIDLLIAGAVEREVEGRSFLGQVSRVLMREVPCSLLLFTNPARETKPLRNVAVVTDFSDLSRRSVRAAIGLAEKCGAEKVTVLRIFTVFAQVLANPDQLNESQPGQDALASEEARLEEFVAECRGGAVPIEARCIGGTTGFAASDFVQDTEVDLLVVCAAAPGSTQIFPDRMEWLESVIPANLLLFREPAL